MGSQRHSGFPGGSEVKNLPARAGDVGWIPGLGRSPEKEMATHSSILASEVPWTKEPGGLQSRGLNNSNKSNNSGQVTASSGIPPTVAATRRKSLSP